MLSPHELYRENCFSWCDYDDGEVLCFAVDRIEKQINNAVVAGHRRGFSGHMIETDPGLIKHLWRRHGLEPHRMARLMPEQVEHWPPILIVEHKERHIMIDGGHRMVRAFQFGLDSIPGWIISAEIWRPYLIDISEIEPDENALRDGLKYYHQQGYSGIA